MKPSSHSARKLARSSAGSAPGRHICISCQRATFQRQYASAAAVAEAPEQPPDNAANQSAPSHETASTGPRPVYRLNAGIVLSRPPVITRDLHPFEKAYFLYQRRLNERLALPFTRYFYFKQGTPADVEWKAKQKERITPARDIGKYAAYSKEGWNDELLVGAQESEPEHQVEALLKDSEAPAVGGGPEAAKEVGAEETAAKKVEVERPMPRTTEADRNNDQQSLNRMLQRALYLLVQRKDGSWTFPMLRIEGRENLRTAAERALLESAGPDMNVWVVGNNPVGHYAQDFEQPIQSEDKQRIELGEKTFFMKGRIMTGQADVGQNLHGLKDFKWLSKEEIKDLVTPSYWRMTQDMLADR